MKYRIRSDLKMKLKKIISAVVGATMLCASLPFSSTMVDFVKNNVITANAEETNETTISIGNVKVSQKNIEKIVRVPVLISRSCLKNKTCIKNLKMIK